MRIQLNDASSILKRDKTKDAFKNVPKLVYSNLAQVLNEAKLNFRLTLLKEIGNSSKSLLTKSVKIEIFMHKTPSNKNVKVYILDLLGLAFLLVSTIQADCVLH